ncbi:MAG TPA: hypothetical protein VNT75_32695 [Symbiobacteriaceae bacterium]|nr:hypothetical protein [Symbiobacteriaceae bacterium]
MRTITRVALAVLAILAGLALAPVRGPVDPRPGLVAPGGPLAQSLAAEAAADLPALAGRPLYRITAAYDPDTRILAGNEEIWLTNASDGVMYNVYLRSEAAALGPGEPHENLIISGLRVGGRPATYSSGETLLVISLPEPLPAGETLRVSFDFRITLPDATRGDLAGLYGAGPYLTGLGGFPVIPPPGQEHDKEASSFGFTWTWAPSLVDLRLDLPEGWSVAGTGLLRESRLVGVTRGAPAVLIGRDLVTLEREVGGARLRVYLPPSRRRYAERVLGEASRGLAAQQELFGPGLQREVKVLFAPLSGLQGANLGGGVMVVDDALLSDVHLPAPRTFSAPELEPLLEWDAALERQMTIYHELGHLWWSELVGRSAGGATQLDEALSEATAVLTLERVGGKAAAERRWQRTTLGYQVARLSGMPDLPLIFDGFNDERQEAQIAYSKGALFFRRLRQEVGDAAFFAALRDTLQKHRIGLMAPEGPLTELPPSPALSELYRRWMREARGDAEIGVLAVTDPAVRAYLGLDD